jgi:ABC-type nitrate/sulfonate/bicarbonate transport system permease component
MKWILCLTSILILWYLLALVAASPLLPAPAATALEMISILSLPENLYHILLTFLRGLLGLLAATVLALVFGVAAGLSPRLMNVISPLVAMIQACPTIIWLSFLMLWASNGTLSSAVCVMVAACPAMFYSIAEGVAALDKRLFQMASLYHVPFRSVLRQILLPGIAPQLLSSLAFSLGITWKVTSTAEFIGAGTGVGSRIFWAFRLLNIEALFCWAIILIATGILIDAVIVRALRQRVSRLKEAVSA